MKTIALDADEVLFPFARGYAAWRTAQGLPSFDHTELTTYDFDFALDASAVRYEHTTAFLADQTTLEIPPLPGAASAVSVLAQTHRLVIVTNRYEISQADSTLAWVERWLPEVSGVICARKQRGDRGPGKASICRDLAACWLVDDTPSHLEGLGDTRGLLYGTYPWQGDRAAHFTHATTWEEAVDHLIEDSL